MKELSSCCFRSIGVVPARPGLNPPAAGSWSAGLGGDELRDALEALAGSLMVDITLRREG